MENKMKPEEEQVLFEFRRILKGKIPIEMHNDTILLMKFLKARDFDIMKAETMIKNNVRWRKEIQLDTILTDFTPPEVMSKHLSSQIIGYDFEGYPIHYIQIGTIDNRGLLKSVNKDYILKSTVRELEKNVQHQVSQTKKLGKSRMQCIAVYDVAHLSLSAITHVESIQLILKYVMIAQDHYPEICKKLYVINVSSYFTMIWPVIQKCLSVELKKKITVYGQDGWQEEFLKIMDAEVLPAFLGGNRTDPDGNPLCFSIVTHPPERVDEKYFLQKTVTDFSQKPGVRSVRIDRKDKISNSIQITVSSSIINWEFLIKNYDIGFGIFLEKAEGSTEELIPIHNIETELHSNIGMYRCKQPGKYIIVFDNSYSWFHIKDIYYRIWITNAGKI